MPRRTFHLFFLVCLFTGICVFLGSGIGNVVSERGLFVGALIGGVLGVLGSTRMAIRTTWIEPEAFGKAALTGTIAVVLAAWVAMKHTNGIVVPILSIGLAGLGVVAGRAWASRTKSGSPSE